MVRDVGREKFRLTAPRLELSTNRTVASDTLICNQFCRSLPPSVRALTFFLWKRVCRLLGTISELLPGHCERLTTLILNTQCLPVTNHERERSRKTFLALVILKLSLLPPMAQKARLSLWPLFSGLREVEYHNGLFCL